MKKVKKDLNVFSQNCISLFITHLVSEDFESLLKMSSTTKRKG